MIDRRALMYDTKENLLALGYKELSDMQSGDIVYGIAIKHVEYTYNEMSATDSNVNIAVLKLRFYNSNHTTNTECNAQIRVTNSAGTSTGYATKFVLGQNLDLIKANSSGGDTSEGVLVYQSVGTNTSYETFYVQYGYSGYSTTSIYTGPATLNANNYNSSGDSSTSFRLVYSGKYAIVNKPTS